jgi:uncharacterized protein YdeI (YjbR/CyaY-like superfamily)
MAATKKPAVKKPAVREPVAQKPAAEKPAAKKPVAKKPAAEKPVAKERAAAKKPTAADARAAAGDASVAFPTPAAWRAWLADNHRSSPGVWLRLGRAASGIPSVTYAEALEGALIWGWIDGQKRSHDPSWWLQRFTPRGAKSLWSKINCAKADALIAAGTMEPPGLAEVARARQDGRWEAAYDPPSRSVMPEDMAAALAANVEAAALWPTLNAANRYAVLWRVQTAKKPETRARRIAELVAMLGRGEKLHP